METVRILLLLTILLLHDGYTNEICSNNMPYIDKLIYHINLIRVIQGESVCELFDVHKGLFVYSKSSGYSHSCAFYNRLPREDPDKDSIRYMHPADKISLLISNSFRGNLPEINYLAGHIDHIHDERTFSEINADLARGQWRPFRERGLSDYVSDPQNPEEEIGQLYGNWVFYRYDGTDGTYELPERQVELINTLDYSIFVAMFVFGQLLVNKIMYSTRKILVVSDQTSSKFVLKARMWNKQDVALQESLLLEAVERHKNLFPKHPRFEVTVIFDEQSNHEIYEEEKANGLVFGESYQYMYSIYEKEMGWWEDES